MICTSLNSPRGEYYPSARCGRVESAGELVERGCASVCASCGGAR